ncbi:MAG: hypothetical protein IPI83_08540 [Sphingomonadales bacterium]|nr:hypothetical protein [Sphingomonadales bacterium]
MPLGFSSLGRSLEDVPLPPVLAVLFGAVAAILVLATPDWMFDRMVLESGFPMLAPSISPPFGEVPRIIAAMAAMWLVAGILWPAFALVSILLAPKPKKGKGFHIEASFDVPAPALQLEALIRASVSDEPALRHLPEASLDPAASRMKAVVRRAAHSIDMPTAPAEVALGETASDAIASRTIEPRKYKARKQNALSGKALGGSETRH